MKNEIPTSKTNSKNNFPVFYIFRSAYFATDDGVVAISHTLYQSLNMTKEEILSQQDFVATYQQGVVVNIIPRDVWHNLKKKSQQKYFVGF